MRWKIETFHKILKSGCKAEESKLRTADRLTDLIAAFCILSWRVFWMTMNNRTMPEESAQMALTQTEIEVLDQLIKDREKAESASPLTRYLVKRAQLGGYLARVSDPPPGNAVMWRGLRRLTDIQLGFELGIKALSLQIALKSMEHLEVQIRQTNLSYDLTFVSAITRMGLETQVFAQDN
jgi:hypothetical protein